MDFSLNFLINCHNYIHHQCDIIANEKSNHIEWTFKIL